MKIVISADAQADSSLCWVHMRSFRKYCAPAKCLVLQHPFYRNSSSVSGRLCDNMSDSVCKGKEKHV